MAKARLKNTVRAAKRAGSFAGEVIAETLWPTRCAICDAPGSVLCESCASKLRFVDACKACPTCGAPYGMTQCTECNKTILNGINRSVIPLNKMVHCVVLDNNSRRLITTYKDAGEQRLARIIAKYIVRYIPPEWYRAQASLTYVPATSAAFRRRGFDHMQMIVREVASITGLPIAPIIASPKSSDQRNLGKRKRIDNMASILHLIDNCEVPKSCILIDDICTTGSTMFAAADMLKSAGCECVYGITFGRVLDI